jgi:hypothetical protein
LSEGIELLEGALSKVQRLFFVLKIGRVLETSVVSAHASNPAIPSFLSKVTAAGSSFCNSWPVLKMS